MKPSERIDEIKEKMPFGYPEPYRTQKAIIDYLDEQWEKNKTGEQRQYDVIYKQQKSCEHEWTNWNGAWGGTVPPPKYQCLKCLTTK